MKLIFVTGNAFKFAMAQGKCAADGVELEQIETEIDEIQGDSPELIAKDKAQKAYEAIGKPVIVGDDSWCISGLNGFPGPYMKQVNNWFTAQDFINLTHDLEDRRITLTQYLVYTDGIETVLFSKGATGILLKEPRGESDMALWQVCAMDYDGGLSIAEAHAAGLDKDPKRIAAHPDAWGDMIAWLKNREA